MPSQHLLNNGSAPLQRGDPVMVPPQQALLHTATGAQRGGAWGELKLDITSEDAARHSLLRYLGCEGTKPEAAKAEDGEEGGGEDAGIQQRELPGVAWGTVLGVDWQTSEVEVLVWRKGDTYFVGAERRPKETYRAERVNRITPVEFWKHCRKAYMTESRRYLRLKGDGHDESIPLSLIAYHNRMIDKLLEKTDGGAKPPVMKVVDKSDKQILGGQRAKLDILTNQGPVTQNTSDPFGDVAEQLKALASVGIGGAGGKKGKANAAQKRAQRSLVSGAGKHGKEKPGEEGPLALPTGAAPTAQNPSALHRQFHVAQSRTMHHLTTRYGARRQALKKSLAETSRALEKGAAGEVVVASITPSLVIKVRDPAASPSPPPPRGQAPAALPVVLADVAFGTSAHHVKATHTFLVDLLLGKQVSVTVDGHTPSGTPVVQMRFLNQKETVQAALVSAGYAQTQATADAGLQIRKKRAVNDRLGIWAATDTAVEKAMAHAGLTPIPDAPPVPLPPRQERAHRLIMDDLQESDEEEAAELPQDASHHLGSLFDHYFASQEFISMAKASPCAEYCL